MTAYAVNGINFLSFGSLCKEEMLHCELCYYSVLFWPFLVPGCVCIPTGLLWAIWSEQPCSYSSILAQSTVLQPITVTQFLSYSFICAVGTPALENARKCQSNTRKYHIVVKYHTPHKERTLIPTANDIEIFQNHISSYGFHSPSFLISAVRVSNKKSVIYRCSCFPLSQVSPNHNFQSCLSFC